MLTELSHCFRYIVKLRRRDINSAWGCPLEAYSPGIHEQAQGLWISKIVCLFSIYLSECWEVTQEARIENHTVINNHHSSTQQSIAIISTFYSLFGFFKHNCCVREHLNCS